MAMGHGEIELDVSAVVSALSKVETAIAHEMHTAIDDAGDAVAASARREHGYQDRTHALTDSIRSDGVEGSFGSGLSVVVAANANHGAPIEFGSKAHDIFAKPGGILRFATISGWTSTKHVNHPGNPPFRFLGEALDREFADVVVFCENALEDAFDSVGFEIQ